MTPNPCEWNPVQDCPASGRGGDGSCEKSATVVVGVGASNVHLCDGCAALPRWKRYTKRRIGEQQTNKGNTR